jgi:hypothetical protein
MRGIGRRREVRVVEDHWRRGRRNRRIDCVVMPANPQTVKTAVVAISAARKARQRKPHVPQHSRRHIPDECLKVDHARNGKSDQRAQHLPTLFRDDILLHPCLWSVAEGEFLRELAVVVAKSAPGDGVRSGRVRARRASRVLPVQLALVWEALVAHDERGQAVGESVNARARLHVGALVGPDNIEARVDAWDGEAVQGRVAEREGGEVVGVWQLLGPRSVHGVTAQRARTWQRGAVRCVALGPDAPEG